MGPKRRSSRHRASGVWPGVSGTSNCRPPRSMISPSWTVWDIANGLIEYFAKSNPGGRGGHAPLGPAFSNMDEFGWPSALLRVNVESTGREVRRRTRL